MVAGLLSLVEQKKICAVQNVRICILFLYFVEVIVAGECAIWVFISNTADKEKNQFGKWIDGFHALIFRRMLKFTYSHLLFV